jgi:hypothetical protein
MSVLTDDDSVRARSIYNLLNDFWGDHCDGDRESQMIGEGPLPPISPSR